MWNKDLVLNHGNDKCVLAIDDEYDIVNLIKLSLEVDGFKVSAFTDPIVALVHFVLHSKDYGIVISDISMPDMNGYEFVKHVKKFNPKVKIILTSAFEIENNEFLNVLPEVKVDAFIQKPFSPKALKNISQEKAFYNN